MPGSAPQAARQARSGWPVDVGLDGGRVPDVGLVATGALPFTGTGALPADDGTRPAPPVAATGTSPNAGTLPSPQAPLGPPSPIPGRRVAQTAGRAALAAAMAFSMAPADWHAEALPSMTLMTATRRTAVPRCRTDLTNDARIAGLHGPRRRGR